MPEHRDMQNADNWQTVVNKKHFRSPEEEKSRQQTKITSVINNM